VVYSTWTGNCYGTTYYAQPVYTSAPTYYYPTTTYYPSTGYTRYYGGCCQPVTYGCWYGSWGGCRYGRYGNVIINRRRWGCIENYVGYGELIRW
jgi:hypothetical protein